MVELLKYIFSSFWIFIGVIVIIYSIGEALINPICKAIMGSVALKHNRNIEGIETLFNTKEGD